MIANPTRNGPPSVWALLDDRAGNRSQALGVAEALGFRFQVQELVYTATAALPNFFVGASFGGLTPSSRVNLVPPWPDLVIAAGRRTAPVARKIKKDSGGTAKLVQIMYPGDAGADEFDLIAAPRHDSLPPRPNRIAVTGAPGRIRGPVLEKAAAEWRGRFEHLPKPWIALIVGGSTRRRTFTDDMARDLGSRVQAMAAGAGGSLLVTTSRRTGEAEGALLAEIGDPSFVFRWGDDGDNPYLGFLALADAVVVTGDSTSMASEACATRAPVYIYAPKALTAHKHARLHAELYEAGYARPLGDTFEAWTHPPLDTAGEVAAEIRRRFGF